MVKIGVVTVTYNSQDVIKPFLNSLFAQTYHNFVLYIIDNNSDDNTIRIIEDFSKPLVCIQNTTNKGVARANNQGIIRAIQDKCSHILLMNNDIEFEEKVIASLINIQQESNYSVVAPKILYFDRPKIIWYAGSYFSKIRSYLPLHIGFQKLDKGQHDIMSEVDYAPGCCLLISKEVFSDIGFMDERFFVYFDDTDFCYRIKKDQRHNILYFPDVKIYHKVGSLTNKKENREGNKFRSNFFIEQNIKNHVYFLKKIDGLFGWLLILWLFIIINIRFIMSTSFKINIQNWILINKSYFKGLNM